MGAASFRLAVGARGTCGKAEVAFGAGGPRPGLMKRCLRVREQLGGGLEGDDISVFGGRGLTGKMELFVNCKP